MALKLFISSPKCQSLQNSKSLPPTPTSISDESSSDDGSTFAISQASLSESIKDVFRNLSNSS